MLLIFLLYDENPFQLPYFIEKLELSSLSLGSTAPRIVGVYTPKLNEWGIWVDLEVRYYAHRYALPTSSINGDATPSFNIRLVLISSSRHTSISELCKPSLYSAVVMGAW